VENNKGIFETIIDIFRKANIKPSWNENNILKQLTEEKGGQGNDSDINKSTDNK